MSRSARLPVAIWLLVVAGCAIVAARTFISADMSAFLPRSPSAAQQVLVDQVQHGAASRLLVVALEGAPSGTLAALSRGLASRLRDNRAFALVSNGADTGAAAIEASPDGAFLWRNRYLLSPGVTAERFTVEGLHAALQDDLKALASNLGSLVKRTLAADPTGEILRLVGRFAGQSQPNRRDGVWFSPDGNRALLVLQTRGAGFEISGAEAALADLQAAFAAEKAAHPDAAEARLLVTGPAVFAVHTKTELKDDISRLSLIGTVLVSAILLLTYRAPRILLLALLPVASGALAGIAAVSLGFGFVHGVTLGFGVTLIGEGVDYAIYLLTQTAPGAPAEATLPRIWPMLLLGVLLSVVGFSAMLFSSFTGFAQLGLFSITGLLTAVAVTRWVLPGLLPRNFATARSAFFAPALFAITRRAPLLRWPMLLALAAAAAALLLHPGSFWDDDLSNLSPIPAADQKLDQTLRRDVGAPDVRYLIVASAPDLQQALASSEQVSRQLDGLVQKGILAGYDAPDQYLPSTATQEARRQALPAAETLRERLAAATSGLPFDPTLFEPFIADVAATKAGPPLERKDLEGLGLGLKLDALLFPRQDRWISLISLRGVTDAGAVTDSLRQNGPADTTFVDLKVESDRLLQTYRREAVLLAGIGSLAIVLLLAIWLRSPRRVILIVVPLAAAVLLTTALLTLGSHKLSIFNLVGLLLTVAVGSNYAIFFERQDWSDPHAERVLASLVLANLCTVIGFGVLSLASFPVLRDIGTTVAAGAFLSLIFSAIVIGSAAKPGDRG